jgi:hypothetical protein
MSKFEIKGGTFRHSHFGDVIHGNPPQELERQLETLRNAVTELSKHVSPEAAAKAQADLERLASEAKSKEPSRTWYDVSAEGLVGAATAVAGMVEPVTKAVTSIGKILFG